MMGRLNLRTARNQKHAVKGLYI